MDCFQIEFDRIRADIERIETRILWFEDNPKFQPTDIRYTRLLEEKKLLVKNLCELRINITAHNSFPISNTSSVTTCEQRQTLKRPRSSDNEIFENIQNGDDTNNDKKPDFNPPSSNIHHQPPSLSNSAEQLGKPFFATLSPPPVLATIDTSHQQEIGNSGQSPTTIISNGNPTSPDQSANETALPAVQMEEYLNTKMKLAQIMRDFNNRKICFVGKDNTQIHLIQYQAISNRVKAGEDISIFLKGKLVVFVTGVDKKKRSITETKLFIPDFELILNK